MKSLVRAATAGLAACAAGATIAIAAAPAVAKAPSARHGSVAARRHSHRHARVRHSHASSMATSTSTSTSTSFTYDALPVVAGSNYLALGDSVTFGYQESQVVPAPDYENAASFPNYPQMLATELHLNVTNLACPGETSSSFIDTSAISNGCENTLGQTGPGDAYRAEYPLHTNYSGSQLAAALAYLESTSNVRLVSLMIGANDVFVCQKETTDNCGSLSEQLKVGLQIAKNVVTILSDIRLQAHYTGQIVIVNYYSPDPSEDSLVQTGNDVVDLAAAPFRVEIADGYGQFAAASVDSGGNPCTAGLLTQLTSLGTPLQCGVHPSYAGHALLAQAVEDAITL